MQEQNETRNEDDVIHELSELGRSWAEYGLVVGRMAMLQSARSLERGARLLDAIVRQLSEDEKTPVSDAPDHP